MDIRQKTWNRITAAWLRVIRFSLASSMALVLCPVIYGVVANFAVSTVASMVLQETSEKSSTEEESRDTSPKLFRVRSALSKKRHAFQEKLAVLPGDAQRHSSRLLTSPLSTECLGPGLYLRC